MKSFGHLFILAGISLAALTNALSFGMETLLPTVIAGLQDIQFRYTIDATEKETEDFSSFVIKTVAPITFDFGKMKCTYSNSVESFDTFILDNNGSLYTNSKSDSTIYVFNVPSNTKTVTCDRIIPPSYEFFDFEDKKAVDSLIIAEIGRPAQSNEEAPVYFLSTAIRQNIVPRQFFAEAKYESLNCESEDKVAFFFHTDSHYGGKLSADDRVIISSSETATSNYLTIFGELEQAIDAVCTIEYTDGDQALSSQIEDLKWETPANSPSVIVGKVTKDIPINLGITIRCKNVNIRNADNLYQPSLKFYVTFEKGQQTVDENYPRISVTTLNVPACVVPTGYILDTFAQVESYEKKDSNWVLSYTIKSDIGMNVDDSSDNLGPFTVFAVDDSIHMEPNKVKFDLQDLLLDGQSIDKESYTFEASASFTGITFTKDITVEKLVLKPVPTSPVLEAKISITVSEEVLKQFHTPLSSIPLSFLYYIGITHVATKHFVTPAIPEVSKSIDSAIDSYIQFSFDVFDLQRRGYPYEEEKRTTLSSNIIDKIKAANVTKADFIVTSLTRPYSTYSTSQISIGCFGADSTKLHSIINAVRSINFDITEDKVSPIYITLGSVDIVNDDASCFARKNNSFNKCVSYDSDFHSSCPYIKCPTKSKCLLDSDCLSMRCSSRDYGELRSELDPSDKREFDFFQDNDYESSKTFGKCYETGSKISNFNYIPLAIVTVGLVLLGFAVYFVQNKKEKTLSGSEAYETLIAEESVVN